MRDALDRNWLRRPARTALLLASFLALPPTALADEYASATAANPLRLYGEELRFDVLRNGDQVGEHIVQFTPQAGGLQVTSRSEIEVKLLFLTAYRFRYQSIEHWRDGSLVKLHAASNDNGDFTNIDAAREGDWLKVKTNGATWQGASRMAPTTHWNMAQTRAPALLNTVTGKLNNVTVTDAGIETVALPGGERQARRFVYSGDLSVESWYDLAGRWVKLQFAAEDGSTIEYLCNSCSAPTEMTEAQ